MKINNWALFANRVAGEVDHPTKAKQSILTSRVVGKTADGKIKTKSGSIYELGDVDPEYEKEFPNARERVFNALPLV